MAAVIESILKTYLNRDIIIHSMKKRVLKNFINIKVIFITQFTGHII